MKVASVYIPRVARALVVADFAIIAGTFSVALHEASRSGSGWSDSSHVPAWVLTVVVTLFILISNFSMGMYQRRFLRGRKLVKSLVASFLTCLISLLFVDNLFLGNGLSFAQILTAIAAMFALMGLSRPLVGRLIDMYLPKRRFALIGSSAMAERVQWAMASNSPADAVLVDHYAFDRTCDQGALDAMLAKVGKNANVEEIFVEMPSPELAHYGRGQTLPLNSTQMFFDRYTRGIDVELLHSSEAADLRSKTHSVFWMKRVIETLVCLVVFVFFLPPFIAAMIAIKLEDGGSIFYRQTRVGKLGRTFSVLKFRSMVENAEAGTGAKWATIGDNRVTRVGSFLRKSRIDELPQLLNIIRGEMALVGPRPERPEFVEMLAREIPNFELRHLVRPGLTGWAQVSYPYGASLEDARCKTRLDLYYINNWTIWFDLAIIAQTVRVVLLAEGSR